MKPKSKYEKDYLEADKYQIFNDNDQDLHPVVLKLPEPPDIRYIDGYGKPPLEQKFEYQELPEKLARLEEQALSEEQEYAAKHKSYTVTQYKIQKRFWSILEENKRLFEKEIEWIKHVHWHLRYGYWFFCKGKPTWLTPWHYRFMNFWYMKGTPNNHPEYRDVDRRTYMWKYYAYTATETFKYIDEDGVPQKNEEGIYEMIEREYRTYYGYGKPKRRREGASNQDMCILRILLEKDNYGECTVVADTGDNAKDLFDEIFIPAWDNEPLFLKPVNNAGNSPNSITLMPPAGSYGEKYLGSKIDFTESAQPRANDRRKIVGILLDESGKTPKGVDERHEVTKLTTAQKYDINGYMMYPSTVEWMNEGGEVYKKLMNQGDFYKRNPQTGQTISGIIRTFNPGYDGMDGYIDAWGYSVINTPTEEQIKYAPKNAKYFNGIGAKEQLTKELEFLLKSGDPNDLSLYNQRLRKEPQKWADCWIGVEGEVGFDTVVLSKRMAETQRKKFIEIGNLVWEGGIKDSKVVWVKDDNGKFEVSDLSLENNNKWRYGDPVWNEKVQGYVESRIPLFPDVYTAGADEFEYGSKTQVQNRVGKVRQSDGGIAVLRNPDRNMEDSDDMYDWDHTYLFTCSYRNRPPSVYEYCEDVLMACVYYGAMLVPERNKTRVIEHFIDRGYGGYLKFLQKPDGTYHDKPGVFTKDVDMLFSAVSDYIKFRGHKDRHYEFLKECFEIKGKEDLTNKDRFAAHAMALLGARSPYGKKIEQIQNTNIDISGIFGEISY